MSFRSVPNLCSVLMIVALLGGCESGDAAETGGKLRGASASGDATERDSAKPGVRGPVLPDEGGRFAPSLVRLVDDEPRLETLGEVEQCGECHAEIVAEWRDSMHAFASFNNPLYRMAFDDFVGHADSGNESNGEKARFCGGCHDPALLFDDSIVDAVEPDDPRAHVGVSCGVCHGVKGASFDGNASYELTTSEIPLPEEDDPASLERHVERVSTRAVDDDALCASCHRGFLTEATGHEAFIQGIDEYRPWARSGYAGNPLTRLDEAVEAQSCTDCHMPEADAGTRSHRFPGGHTSFAKMIGSEEQLQANQELLGAAATLDIAAVGTSANELPAEPEPFSIAPGDTFWFDVVVRNTGVGHNLPGGSKDLKDTWLEVVVSDVDGNRLALAGVKHAGVKHAGDKHAEGGDDPSAHRFRVLLVDDEGQSEEGHDVAHFRTPAFDHTISPRDAATVRYRWTLPESLSESAFPLQVRVKLRHRRLNKAFADASCRAFGTERGQAFAEAAQRHLSVNPDPCVEQPIFDMNTASASIGRDSFELPQLPERPAWKRWFERGLGLQRSLSEQLYEAHDSFDRALAALGEEGDKHHRAMALVGKAQVFARQGSDAEAIAHYDRAEALIGEHPTLFYGRGAAYARVWRFAEAVEQYELVSQMVDDDRIWRRLAQGRGSLSRSEAAYEAARRGLAHEPRDPDLLRSQLLALRALGAPDELTEDAARAYRDFKKDEDAHLIEAICGERSELCQLERLPVHAHELQTVQ